MNIIIQAENSNIAKLISKIRNDNSIGHKSIEIIIAMAICIFNKNLGP